MFNLRVLFMGSPPPAIPVLRAVKEIAGVVVGVYTQPDRQAGRGRRIEPTAVKRYALDQGLPVYQPPSLRDEGAREQVQALAPDLVVLAAYGKILPRRILELPRLGCVNLHPSLLPRHRGATPVAGAILAGDEVTGATLFVMDEGMDTGPILAQRDEQVRPDDRTPELTERLFALGAELAREALPAYAAGRITPLPQTEEGMTVTRRLTKEDGELDWTKPAVALEREVRAYFPWPSSFTYWQGKQLQVLEAGVTRGAPHAPAGTVVQLSDDPAITGVVTGEGALALRTVRLAGRPAMATADFLRGYPSLLGAKLPS